MNLPSSHSEIKHDKSARVTGRLLARSQHKMNVGVFRSWKWVGNDGMQIVYSKHVGCIRRSCHPRNRITSDTYPPLRIAPGSTPHFSTSSKWWSINLHSPGLEFVAVAIRLLARQPARTWPVCVRVLILTSADHYLPRGGECCTRAVGGCLEPPPRLSRHSTYPCALRAAADTNRIEQPLPRTRYYSYSLLPTLHTPFYSTINLLTVATHRVVRTVWTLCTLPPTPPTLHNLTL